MDVRGWGGGRSRGKRALVASDLLCFVFAIISRDYAHARSVPFCKEAKKHTPLIKTSVCWCKWRLIPCKQAGMQGDGPDVF